MRLSQLELFLFCFKCVSVCTVFVFAQGPQAYCLVNDLLTYYLLQMRLIQYHNRCVKCLIVL